MPRHPRVGTVHPLRSLAVALLAGAVASFGWGWLQGDLQGGLFLVFPVLIGSGPWALLGMLLLFGAFVAWSVGVVREMEERGHHVERQEPAWSEPRDEPSDGEDGGFFSGGGIVLLGPIPIVWGSDERTTLWIALVALVLMVVALAWWWLAGGGM